MSHDITIFLGKNGNTLGPGTPALFDAEGAFATLVKEFQEQIKFDRDSGADAATRDLQSAQSMARKAYDLRDALLEIISLLFPVLLSCVERNGWTPDTVRQLDHLRRRCEQLPVEREREGLLDLVDEFRAKAGQIH